MSQSAELMREIKSVLEMWSEHIAIEVMTRWMQLGYAENLTGNAEVKTKVKKQAENMLLMEITGKGQRALMIEYGRGSKMDMLNPYLDEYLRWSGFNQARAGQGMAILTREPGKTYKDLDGRAYKSTAANAGVNLEQKGDPRFLPEEPHHVIRNIVCGDDGEQGVLNAILDDLAEIIALHNFFKQMPTKIRL